MAEISKILIESDGLAQALRGLYEYRKATNKRYSLQFICNQAQIPSKGHLADVMASRRNLKATYTRSLCKTLGLDSRQSKVFTLLSKIQRAHGEVELTKLQHQLSVAKKLLKSVEVDFKAIYGDPVDFSRAFCSIGLFKPGSATQKNISQALRLDSNYTQTLLDQLVARSFLVEKNGVYKLSDREVHFSKGEYVGMVKAYLSRSLQQVDQKIDSKDSFYESSTVSVSLNSYQKMLPKLKEIIFESMSELETEAADALVHFNIQIYPD